jgi:hypothetical protein
MNNPSPDNLEPQTPSTWQDKLREAAGRLPLQPELVAELEAQLAESASCHTLPTLFTHEEVLGELLLKAQAFGAEAAVAALEFTLAVSAVAQKASGLEGAGLLGPAPRVALEFVLAELLPHLGAKVGGQARSRLKTLLMAQRVPVKAAEA